MESVKRAETKNKAMQTNSSLQNMHDLYQMGVFAKTFSTLKNEENPMKQSIIGMSLLLGR